MPLLADSWTFLSVLKRRLCFKQRGGWAPQRLALFLAGIATLGHLPWGTQALADDKEDGEEEQKPSGIALLAQVIPLGQEQKNFKLPSYEGTSLASLTQGASMRRVDDKHLFITEMVITTYGKGGKEEMTVKMPTATYHLVEGSLKSDERSVVSREDFDIEGDRLLFDNARQFGRMDGNIRMTIKDASAFAAAPSAEATDGDADSKNDDAN